MIASAIIPRSAVLATLLWCSAPLAAQQPAIPKFPVDASPIQLAGDVRPHQYLGVVGRRAAWLGTETGEAELWVHPFKLADRFQLAFRIPDYQTPIRGADVARRVIVRPEATTIVYSHATFTVREHIVAPLDYPGVLVLLDVETLRPLKIEASFRMVFQYAWPAAFGGQYIFWNGDEHAFVLSESLRKRSAMIGSPWATEASEHPAHALPDAPAQFVIPVDTGRARREFIPIAIVAAEASRDSVLALYHGLLAHADQLYRARVQHAVDLLTQATTIDSPDPALDLAERWSLINLDESVVCNPDLGCGLVAGWGPSGESTRPGFGWFFGGDAAINSFAMSLSGEWSTVAEGLRFLTTYQRADGKIPHEISQAAAHIPWFTDFPYPYYHADTTPYWIVALWRYWRATGDDALLQELWPAVMRAYGWCLTRDTDGDGIIENGPENLGAIEVGALGEGIHEDIYLAAVWTQALEAMHDLAAARGQGTTADSAAQLRARALRTLNERYWRPADHHHAFGILTSGKTNDNLTVWPATAATFSLLDSTRADLTLTKLATDSISADWGAHILSTGSALYDPMHYNNGAVWPFVTGFVAWGQYNYRRPWSAFPLVDALKQLTFDFARGRHPELLSGRFYRPLDTAVPQQFFATSMLLSPMLAGMLGWDPDAPHRRARLAPQIPPNWPRFTVHRLRVGATALDVDLRQSTHRTDVTVTRHGPPITLDLLVRLPAGARDIHASGGAVVTRAGPRETTLSCTVTLSDSVTSLAITWTGGLAIVPPTVVLEPGQESHGVRVLDFRADGGGWRLTLEGECGRRYELKLVGVTTPSIRGANLISRSGDVSTIGVEFPAGSGRTVQTVVLGS